MNEHVYANKYDFAVKYWNVLKSDRLVICVICSKFMVNSFQRYILKDIIILESNYKDQVSISWSYSTNAALYQYCKEMIFVLGSLHPKVGPILFYTYPPCLSKTRYHTVITSQTLKVSKVIAEPMPVSPSYNRLRHSYMSWSLYRGDVSVLQKARYHLHWKSARQYLSGMDPVSVSLTIYCVPVRRRQIKSKFS